MTKNVSPLCWAPALVLAAGCGRTGLIESERGSLADTGAAGALAGAGGADARPGTGGVDSATGGRVAAGGADARPGTGGVDSATGGRVAAGGSTEPSTTGGSSGDQKAVCQLVERYQVPSGAGAAAADPFPSDRRAIDSGLDAPQDDALPPVPGHHVLLRRGSRSRHSPALATSGSVLGVAFVEGTRLRFGVSSNQAHEASSFTFADIIDVATATTLEPLLAGDAQGFCLGWIVDGGSRSTQVLSARLDRRGRITQGPWQLASSELACAMSSSADTLAVACTEGRAHETWVELCPPDQNCVRCFLGESNDLVRPAMAWDGSAFDLVYPSNEPFALRLTRFTASGEEILPAVPLAGFELDDTYEPAIAFDGDNLAVVYGSELRVFDLGGRLVQGPWALPGTVTRSQVVGTSSGYAVLHKPGLAGTDAGLSWVGEGSLSGSTLLAPSRGVDSFSASATAAVVRADDAVFTVHEVQDGAGAGSSLVLARFDEVTGALDRDPELLGSNSAALQPIAVRCETSACYVLANEPSAGVGYPERSYGIWRVERATDAVTPPAAELTAPGLAVAAPAVSTTGTATLLLRPGSAVGPYLALWSYEDSLSKSPGPEGSYRTGASLFFEEEALRVFCGDAQDSAQLNETLYSDGRFQTPSAVGAEGVQARCGAAYYAFTKDDPNTAQRWRPDIESAFTPAFVVTSSAALNGVCCNDRLLAIQGSVVSLEGEYVASPDSTSRGCASAGDALLLVAPLPHANGLLLEQVSPSGELLRWRLTVPEGVQGPGPNTLASGDVAIPEIPWALSSDGSQIALAWYDPEWGDAFLSTWRLP
ncbi:MAG: hypothetical protein JW940_25655 [Polyangiaceae bacterium]|nr:hypothetical protein [Polyangiaceae bacterium]